MKESTSTGTVLVVAQESMHAARVESALHLLVGWRIVISTVARIGGDLEQHPGAIVIVVFGDAEPRRMLRAIRGWPRSPSIVGLGHNPAAIWTSAARAVGLRAALPLGATPEELSSAVRAVSAGLLVVHPNTLVPRGPAMVVDSGMPLTSREREILEMMADGENNRMIAARLGISRHTVKFHVTSILTKLGASGRTEAVALALRRGLLAV